MDEKLALIPIEQQQIIKSVSQQIGLTEKLLSLYNDDLPELIPYRKGNKWGYCDRNKKIVIECIYEFATEFINNIARTNLGFVNRKGELISSLWYDDVQTNNFTNDGFISLMRENKWGVVNTNGDIVIPFIYERDDLWIERFVKGYLCIKIKGKLKIFDNNGREYVSEIYNYTGLYSEEMATIRNGKGYFGVVNAKLEIVVPCIYEVIGKFENGVSIVTKNGKIGLINKKGSEIIPCIYDYINSFNDGLAFFGKDEKNGVINTSGDIIRPCTLSNEECGRFYYSEGLLLMKKSNKRGYVNAIGEEVIPFKYKNAWNFKDGMARARKNKKWGFIDNNGNLAVEFNYRMVWDFKDGFAGVKKYGKWGFINKSGELIVPFIYDRVGEFHNGFAGVQKKSMWGLVNTKGEEVVACLYNYVFGNSENPFKPFALNKTIIRIWKKTKIKKFYNEYDFLKRYYFTEHLIRGYINSEGLEYWED
jgi:hypothetical protein